MLGIETFLIILLSLLPSLLSVLVVRKAKQRMQSRLRQARTSLYRQQWASRLSYSSEGLEPKPFVGDLSCQFNARSPYLRCAVNPSGPCENCSHYQPKA